MTPTSFVLASGALTFGVPLVIALREIALTRRGGGQGWRPERRPPTPPPPPPSGSGQGMKPLPDCLIPKPAPRTTAPRRVLETV